MLKFEGKKLTIDFEEAERLLRKGVHKAAKISKDTINYTVNKVEDLKETIDDKKSEKEAKDLFNKLFEEEQPIDERSNDEIAASIQRDAKELASRGVTNFKDFIDETKIKAEIGLDNLLQYKDEKIEDLFKVTDENKPLGLNNSETFQDYLQRVFSDVKLPEDKQYIHEVILTDEGIVIVFDGEVDPDVEFEINKIYDSIKIIVKNHIATFEEYVDFALLFEDAPVFFLDKNTNIVSQPLSLFKNYEGMFSPEFIANNEWKGIDDLDSPNSRIALSLTGYEIPFDYKELAELIKETYPQLTYEKIEKVMKQCEKTFEEDGLFYYLLQLKDLLDVTLGLTMFTD